MIVALWILLILSVLVVSLSFRGSIEARIARTLYERFVADEQMRSAVYIGMGLIEADEEPLLDTVNDRWKNEDIISTTLANAGCDNVTLTITDEESKLNINGASEEMLTAFFMRAGNEHLLDGEPEDMAAAVMVFRGIGTKKGPALDLQKKGRPFYALEEMCLLPAFKHVTAGQVQEYLTVYPQKGNIPVVNINTAPLNVLAAVMAGTIGDDAVKKELLTAIDEYRHTVTEDGAPVHFSRKDLSAYRLLDTVGLTREVKLVSIAVQFLRYMTINSQYFSLQTTLKETPGRSVTAIIGPSTDGAAGASSLAILSWRRQ